MVYAEAGGDGFGYKACCEGASRIAVAGWKIVREENCARAYVQIQPLGSLARLFVGSR